MKILITGAGGFVGHALAESLQADPAVTGLVLTDVVQPRLTGPKISALKADLTSPDVVKELFGGHLDVVYLLHGIMSGAAEANLELGLKVNVDSMRLIMDVLRQSNPGICVVFPSSLAVFSTSPETVVDESTMPLPRSSYGTQKLICETLLNDFSRRGLLDARIVRLPTIIVRPGQPSGAASSFCSGIIREPLKGEKSQLPVPKSTELWVCSTRTVVKNLVLAKGIPKDRFGTGSRIVNFPGRTVAVQQMLDALQKVGGDQALSLVEQRQDPSIEAIVCSWPCRFNTARADELGFLGDGSLEQTIQEYIQDFGGEAKS